MILILQVDDFEESSKKLALTVHSLDPSGLYVFDDGFSFIIWLGRMFPSDIVNKVLGIDLSIFADLSKVWFTLKMSLLQIKWESTQGFNLYFLMW